MPNLSEKSIRVLLAVLFAATFCSAAGTLVNLAALDRGTERLERSQSLALGIEQVLSTLKDAETGQRGYLLTGDESDLEPYRGALERLPELLDRVAQSLSPPPGPDRQQHDQLQRFRALADEKLRELEATVRLAGRGDTDQAIAVVREGTGRRLMSQLRDLGGQLRAGIDRQVARGTERVRRSRITLWWAIATTMLAGLLTLGTVVAIRRLERRRAREREQWLEREREARREAERANQSKDEFVAVLGHELRTPLNAILGWSHVLRRLVPHDATAASALAAIERNAHAQEQLLSDLLDTSSILAGNMRIAVRPMSLHRVIDTAIDSVRPAADARGVRIETALDREAGAMLGDEARLQQVAWNLLSNAIKFTPRGGRVLVELRRSDSRIRLSVTDTGEGIDPRVLPHVFERYRQADGGLRRQHGGLGLGLSIVRQLVELHGGGVEAHSAGLGRGASFVVTLPAPAAAPGALAVPGVLAVPGDGGPGACGEHDDAGVSPAPLPRRPAPVQPDEPAAATDGDRLAGMRVLLVDDDADSRQFVATLLSAHGARVYTVAGGSQALAHLDEWRPHVIVSDIGMPGMDGYELLRLVRAREAANGRRTPAIALTAFARAEDRAKSFQAGFQLHLAKPVNLGELVEAIASQREAAGGD